MGEKKDAARFTIQFTVANPQHRQVTEILNRQGRRSKAQYIVNAVLHYENSAAAPPPTTDEKLIENIVLRLLREREQPKTPSHNKRAAPPNTASTGPLDFDRFSALGADDLDAIAGALEAFRGDDMQ